MTEQLITALVAAQRAINSMKDYAETAAQGDEDSMLYAMVVISNEGLKADMAIREVLLQAAPVAAAMPNKLPIPPAPVDALEVVYAEGWNACCEAFFGGKPALEPIVITVTEQAAPVAAIRDQALEDAAKECEAQVPPGCSTHIADVARNQGIRACTDAIRAMKGAT